MAETTEVRRRLPEMCERLRRFAHKLTRNQTDAEDLTQEACLKALLCEDQYQEGTQLWSWLARTMHTVWIDSVRHNAIATECHAKYLHILPPATSMPADTNAIVADMECGLAKLSAEHREIIMSMYIRGNSQKEAGRIIGIPAGTAGSRSTRAREQLALFLEYA